MTSPLTPPSLAVARPWMGAPLVPPPPRVKLTRVLGGLAASVRRRSPPVAVVGGVLLQCRRVVMRPAVARHMSAFFLPAHPPTTVTLPSTPARGGRWLVGAAATVRGVAGGLSRRARRPVPGLRPAPCLTWPPPPPPFFHVLLTVSVNKMATTTARGTRMSGLIPT